MSSNNLSCIDVEGLDSSTTRPCTGEGWAVVAAVVGVEAGIAGASMLSKVLAVPWNGVARLFGSCRK